MKRQNEKLSILIFLIMVLSALSTVGWELSSENIMIVIQTVILYMIVFRISIYAIKKIQGWLN